MNFKIKAYLQKGFSILPKGEKINYFFQKHVTKSLPISDEDFVNKMKSVKFHYDNYVSNTAKPVQDSTYFEFGTGYDMTIPLAISLLGFKELTCIDIRFLVFPELVNDTLLRFSKLKDKLPFEFDLPSDVKNVTHKNFKDILKDKFRINYVAPLDARSTGIKEGSIDFIVSNATFEHIPGKDILNILLECKRILSEKGIMSNAIDYRDHWSFFDNQIDCYNYLKYSEEEWSRFNPSIMFQNRLRHKDYIGLINKSGLNILEERTGEGSPKELNQLAKMKLDSYFGNKYTLKELGIKSSIIVLSKGGIL